MKIDRRNDLSLRLLEVFGAVMDWGTTTGAAEHLGISQPAVSNGIRTLERQLGLALFERTGRRLRPTEDARLLLRETEPILAMLRALEGEVRDLKHSRSGRLRIAVTPPLGHTVAPQALRELLDGRERVQVRFSVRRLSTVASSVESGAADVGIFLGMVQSDALTSRRLAEVDLVAVMPRDHPLAAREVVRPGDLARHPLVGLDTAIGALTVNAFAQAGEPHAPRIEARYSQTACALVAAGLGVSVVDRYTAEASAGLAIVARQFEPTCTIPVTVVTRAAVATPKLAALFIEIMRRRLSAQAEPGNWAPGPGMPGMIERSEN